VGCGLEDGCGGMEKEVLWWDGNGCLGEGIVLLADVDSKSFDSEADVYPVRATVHQQLIPTDSGAADLSVHLSIGRWYADRDISLAGIFDLRP
jgi:hypothetical protein